MNDLLAVTIAVGSLAAIGVVMSSLRVWYQHQGDRHLVAEVTAALFSPAPPHAGEAASTDADGLAVRDYRD